MAFRAQLPMGTGVKIENKFKLRLCDRARALPSSVPINHSRMLLGASLMSTQNAMMIRLLRPVTRYVRVVGLAALLAFVGSCSNAPSNTQTPPPPSFTLSASSTSLSLQRGEQGTDTITVVPANNFDGTVAFTVSGLPTGVTAAFNPGDATTGSTLTLTAASTASLAG